MDRTTLVDCGKRCAMLSGDDPSIIQTGSTEPIEWLVLTATFLGHQGWLFASGQSRILVDPLLVEPFGHRGSLGFVYPPRDLDIQQMPPVDAVFLSHEHEDHFNIPSVNCISRHIPFYVPERSSIALREILVQLGFIVHTIRAGEDLKVGGLRLSTFSAEHSKRDESDEWDTLPFAVIDLEGGAGFFSSVDVSPPVSMEAAWNSLSQDLGIWCVANNATDSGSLVCPNRVPQDPLLIASRLVSDHARRFEGRALPLATIFCGSGFALAGDLAPMNNILFPLNSTALATAFSALRSTERFLVAEPGEEFTVTASRVLKVGQATFLKAQPRDQWPDRVFRPRDVSPPPLEELHASFGMEAGTEQLGRLCDLLKGFAEYLYGTALFRGLYSIDSRTLGEVKPTFAIRAIVTTRAYVFEYDAPRCEFVVLDEDVCPTKYVVFMECFAADLLGFLTSQLPISEIMFGKVRRWYTKGYDLIWALDRALWQYGHPLRHPDQFLEFYRAVAAAETSQISLVRWVGGQ